MTNKKVPSDKKKEEEIRQPEAYKTILVQFFPKPFLVLPTSDQRLKFLSSDFCLSHDFAKEWLLYIKRNDEGGSG